MRILPLSVLAAIANLAHCVPAAAAWDVGSFRDPMSDRTYHFASTAAKDKPGATLYVGCMNGAVTTELDFNGAVPVNLYSKVGISYRFDDGPLVPVFAFVSGQGKRVYPGWSVAQVRGSKRLRVQVLDAFLDFDLTGAAAAVGSIRCG